jgi:hypothetical protein
MDEYRFVRINEALYDKLGLLMEAAFGVKRSREFFARKMDTSYTGVKHLGFIALDEAGNAAAFYGVYPQWVEYQGKRYLAAQSGDTMTHPQHGGKGLFTKLAQLTYELAKNEGIQFVFGFPNKNSYPGFVRKLNWTDGGKMVNHTMKVTALPIAGLVKKIGWLLPFYMAYQKLVLAFYPKGQPFASSVKAENVGIVERDSSYIRYKMFNDTVIVNISNTNVWLKVDGALLIGDIDWGQNNNVEKLLQRLKMLAFLLGCNKVIFPVSPGCKWDDQLQGKLEVTDGIYAGYLDLQSGLPLERFKYVLADFDTF